MDKWIEKLRRFSPFQKKAQKSFSITFTVVWNLILLFFVIGIIGLCFAGGVGAGYFASLVKDEPIRSYEVMKNDVYNYEETSEIYFANDVYLGKLTSDLEREEIQLEDVSPHLVNAVIATEDELFYEHEGVVPKAIMRALFQEFTNSSTRTGGSTLTQQLIKNQILTNEVSFDRKAKEILLALRLERFFEKEEILEAYLNMADLGRNASGRNIAGIQTAAQGIFGVEAKDLNIAQSAFIAGLPQSPFGYTPFTNSGEVKESLEPGTNRMKTVLNRMYTGGFITKDEYDNALTYNIKENLTKKKPSSIDQYPYLTYEVEARAIKIIMKHLAEKDGYTEEDLAKDDKLYSEYFTLADYDLRQQGYRIHTTINKTIYDKMQTVAKEYEYYGSDKEQTKVDPDTGKNVVVKEPVEAGAVLIENNSGKILSFVGGRDHSREETNHATISKRQNGSTMKPLLVYAPAMEVGAVQPGTVIADTPYSAGGRNFVGTHGLTSARAALQYSYNVPAVKTYMKVIDQRPSSYLEKMGFTDLPEVDKGGFASLSLGGMTDGVTVEENVNAYTTFANGGKFIDAYMIEKIETSNGEVVYEHESKQTDVFSPQTAYLTIDMMRDVVNKGTAASLKGYLSFYADWAGKTGTTQETKDAWFVASNPNVTFGTWIGYDTPKPLEQKYKGLSYSKRNILLWAKLMNVAHEVSPDLIAPKERFKMPGGIVSRSYCALTGELPSDLCKRAGLIATDLFNVKYVPTKVDNSLTQGKYVFVKDRAYRVSATAPSEFVLEGVMLKKEILAKHNISNLTDLKKLLPNTVSWDNLVITEDKEIGDNGANPTPVSGVAASGGSLSWKANGDNDVIGYRVYAAANFSTEFKKVASVPASKSKSASIGNNPAAYYVVAVDVAGKESAPSAIIKNGEYADKKPEEKPKPEDKPQDPPKEDKPEPKDPPKDDGGKKEKPTEENPVSIGENTN